MRKYVEARTLTANAVRDMCVRNGLYTCGDNEAYRKMLARAAEKWVVELEDLAIIAEDIAAHSEAFNTAERVMSLLAREAVRYVYAAAEEQEEETTC